MRIRWIGLHNFVRLCFFIALFLCMILGINVHTVQAYDNITIVIDPGHGGPGIEDTTDFGANYNGVLEKDLTLKTAEALMAELLQYGNVTVYLTRAEDKRMSLKERVDYAAALGADMLVSVHYNASEFHRFYGTEIFTSAFGQNYASGYGMAGCIMNRWTETGAANKGIKTRIGKKGTDYYGLIRLGAEANIPTIILEHGYIDNDEDWSRIGNEAAWQQLGQLDATGIADYFGFKKNVVQTTVAPTVSIEVPTNTVQPDLTSPENLKVTINQYDASKNQISFTIHVSEPESNMMYYGISTQEEAENEETSFMSLMLWEGGADEISGTYTVPEGFDGNLIFRVYNNYELYTDSEPVRVSLSNAVNQKENTEEKQTGTNQNDVNPAISGNDILNDVANAGQEQTDTGITDKLENVENTDANSEANADISSKTGATRDAAFVGMIAAVTLAVMMLGIFIAIAVSTNNKRHRKHRRR